MIGEVLSMQKEEEMVYNKGNCVFTRMGGKKSSFLKFSYVYEGFFCMHAMCFTGT